MQSLSVHAYSFSGFKNDKYTSGESTLSGRTHPIGRINIGAKRPETICLIIQIIHMAIRGRSRGRVQGVRIPLPEITCGFLTQLVFCKTKTMWFIGVEVEQETSAPPPKKNPGSAPGYPLTNVQIC